MTTCVMCAENEATITINSPNHDYKRVGTWDICWECGEYVKWMQEMIRRDLGIRIEEVCHEIKLSEPLPEGKTFEQWFLEKYNRKPTIPYTSLYPIERRLNNGLVTIHSH